MTIPFGKFQGDDLSDLGYDELPYMTWLQTVCRRGRFKQELEWRILQLEAELDILNTYYAAEAG